MSDSLLLGEALAEVGTVPAVVSESIPGPHNQVCIFDQNMHWPEGSILGPQLCRDLRERKFSGLLVIRTANDDESHFQEHMDAGADAMLSKGVRTTKGVAPEITRLYHERVMGVEIGFVIKAKMRNGI